MAVARSVGGLASSPPALPATTATCNRDGWMRACQPSDGWHPPTTAVLGPLNSAAQRIQCNKCACPSCHPCCGAQASSPCPARRRAAPPWRWRSFRPCSTPAGWAAADRGGGARQGARSSERRVETPASAFCRSGAQRSPLPGPSPPLTLLASFPSLPASPDQNPGLAQTPWCRWPAPGWSAARRGPGPAGKGKGGRQAGREDSREGNHCTASGPGCF